MSRLGGIARAIARGWRRERTMPPPADDPRAGLAVLALLAVSGACSIGFAVAYVLDAPTQVLGAAIASALGTMSAAAIVAALRIVPQEEHSEPLGEHLHREERVEAAQIVREGGAGVSRRRLLIVAAGGSVGLCGAALALPAASLGPVLETERLLRGPWRRGRRLVDEHGVPLRPEVLEDGAFATAFPDGVGDEKRVIDSPVIVVRVPPDWLQLPPERAGWAVQGIVAYSKICTHAACAVSEFDYPLYPEAAPPPRLVCPCHYSAFDAVAGGLVVAGPAGRRLPQLPLALDDDGVLVAGGPFSEPPGPSWRNVRE